MTTYTTGQLAKMFGVSPSQANRWCDTGTIKSFRIPGSLHRRVSQEQIEAFLIANPDVPRPACMDTPPWVHAAAKTICEMTLTRSVSHDEILTAIEKHRLEHEKTKNE